MHRLFPKATILDVDLTNNVIKTEELPADIYRLYPGGSALATYILLKNMKANTDPLGEDNILVFSVSPLTGLPIGGLSRLNIASKSPLTGAIGDSQAGGYFAVNMKANGYDAIVFRGKAPKPVYLYINQGNVSIHSAEHLWGKNTGETEDLIKEELKNDKIEVAQIGPAGENLVKFACVINACNRANGRTGNGAVMGSKNLKAVVVSTDMPKPKPFDKEGFKSLVSNIKERIAQNPSMQSLNKYGTSGELIGHHEAGFLATRNFRESVFDEGAEKITGSTMANTILIGNDTCYACPVRCKRVVEVKGKVDSRYGGPEYETCAAMGSYCGIDSLETIALANQLCNMYGLDTICCGAVIAFAMECFEEGIITLKDTEGLSLNFGNDEALIEMIHRIKDRRGIGDLLSHGSRYAAEKLGGRATKLALTVKGLEIPAHMPQYKPSVGIIYAVNPFGADHQSSEHDPVLLMPEDSMERRRLGELGILKEYNESTDLDDYKARYAIVTQHYYSILDTLCLCQFVWGPSWQLFGPTDLVNLCKYGIGWDTSLYELMMIGERRVNLMKWFNFMEGFTSLDDKLPDRFFEPIPSGPSMGKCLDRNKFNDVLNTYYEIAGWDAETGRPLNSTIKRLSLEWLLDL